MSMGEDCAAPQSVEPSSKSIKNEMKDHYGTTRIVNQHSITDTYTWRLVGIVSGGQLTLIGKKV
jgi:hypothetical protein